MCDGRGIEDVSKIRDIIGGCGQVLNAFGACQRGKEQQRGREADSWPS